MTLGSGSDETKISMLKVKNWNNILIVVKILTIVSYCNITIMGDHLGGPFGVFILLYLIAGFLPALLVMPIIIIIISLVLSLFRPRPSDFKIFLFGGLVLCCYVAWYAITYPSLELKIFVITASFFVLFWIVALIGISKTFKHSTR
jgi:hypothetical protein